MILEGIADLWDQIANLRIGYTAMTRRMLIEARALSKADGDKCWLNPTPEESQAEANGIDVDAIRASLGDKLAADRIAERTD